MSDLFFGILSGMGKRWQEQQENLLKQETERRQSSQQFWQSLAEMPAEAFGAPGKKEEAFQNFYTYLQTPPGKKIKNEAQMFQNFFTMPYPNAPETGQIGAPQPFNLERPGSAERPMEISGKPDRPGAGTPYSIQAPSPPPRPSVFTSGEELQSRATQRALDLEAAKTRQAAALETELLPQKIEAYRKIYPNLTDKELAAVVGGHAMPSTPTARLQRVGPVIVQRPGEDYDVEQATFNPLNGEYTDPLGNRINEILIETKPRTQTRLDETGRNVEILAVDQLGRPLRRIGFQPLQQTTPTVFTDPLTGRQGIIDSPRLFTTHPPGTLAPGTVVDFQYVTPGVGAPGVAPPPGPPPTTTPTTPTPGTGAGAAPAPGSVAPGSTAQTPPATRVRELPPLGTPEERRQITNQLTRRAVSDPSFLQSRSPAVLNEILENAEKQGIVLLDQKSRDELRELFNIFQLLQSMKDMVGQIKILQDPRETAKLATLLDSTRAGISRLITRNVFLERGALSEGDVNAAMNALPSSREALVWKRLAVAKLDLLESYVRKMQDGYLRGIGQPYRRDVSGNITGPNVISKSATRAQIQAYATQFGMTYAEAEAAFIKEGYTVPK